MLQGLNFIPSLLFCAVSWPRMAVGLLLTFTLKHTNFQSYSPLIFLSATTWDVWIIPSCRIWDYVLHVEHIQACVITNYGQFQSVIPSLKLIVTCRLCAKSVREDNSNEWFMITWLIWTLMSAKSRWTLSSMHSLTHSLDTEMVLASPSQQSVM